VSRAPHATSLYVTPQHLMDIKKLLVLDLNGKELPLPQV
jgi:hypothetical protein